METITVYPDQSKACFYSNHPLEDLGYMPIGTVIYMHESKKVEADLFMKDEELYFWRGMMFDNITVYEIYLGNLKLIRDKLVKVLIKNW